MPDFVHVNLNANLLLSYIQHKDNSTITIIIKYKVYYLHKAKVIQSHIIM